MDKPKQASSNTPDKKNNKKISNWIIYSGMAFEMFGIIGIFAAAGYYLDGKFSTSPGITVVFLMLGLAIAFYRIYKQII